MRRKQVEALVATAIRRTGLNPRPDHGQGLAVTKLDLAATKRDVEVAARRDVAHAIEEVYRNGGDRRSDPNRADRFPK